MTDGLNFMKSNFGMQSELLVGVDGVDYNEMQALVEKISQTDIISQGKGTVVWIGTIKDMEIPSTTTMKSEFWALENKDAIISALSSAGLNIIHLTSIDMNAFKEEMLTNQSLLSIFYPNADENGVITFNETTKSKYLCMLMLDVPSSADETLDLLREIDNQILEDYDHAVGGDAEIVREVFDSTINEMYKYILVAVLVMFIILILTTTSFIEPVIFMLTIGISIIINMGSNILFGSVSIITFSCSAVLQLGLSMDYSIFLMHAFSEEKKKTLDENLAMKRAIPKTFATVTASALTTVGGFLALFIMRFEIGADLGKVLAKGVFLSLVTVVLLQPCLMLMTSKWSNKTSHKIYLPKFKTVGKFSITNRKIIVLIAIILLVPSFILQTLEGDRLSYIKFVEKEEAAPGSIQETVDKLSNSIIVLVPTENEDANKQFIEDISNVENVSNYLNIYTMIPEQFSSMIKLVNNQEVMNAIEQMPSLSGSLSMLKGFVNNGWTMCMVMMDAESESAEETAVLNSVRESLNKNFGENTDTERNYYCTGMSQGVQDLKEITPTDNLWVTIVSVLIILVILVFTQKSIKLPVILIALIELGIFINLSLCYIAGEDLNFMCYIILSSIQLGSTVDYAILYTDKYQTNLKVMPANEAAYKALRDSAVSILTSVAIMAGCCLSVTIVASNAIVRQITWLIARGAIISGILTLLVLPALLVVFTGNKKLKKKGKEKARTIKKEEKSENIA